MMAQGMLSPALMEADVGTAKYEHVYRSVVWRIPRLPVRNQGKAHLYLISAWCHNFLGHLNLTEHKVLEESYWNQSMSVVCRHAL